MILQALRHVDEAASIARYIIDRLRGPVRLADRVVSTSASLGITICPFDSKDVERLLVDADLAMYTAKAAGRDRFAFYSCEHSAIDARSPSACERESCYTRTACCPILAARSRTLSAISSSGTTSLTAPSAIASRGIPKTTQLASSWAKV